MFKLKLKTNHSSCSRARTLAAEPNADACRLPPVATTRAWAQLTSHLPHHIYHTAVAAALRLARRNA